MTLVLVVDDDPIIRIALQNLLASLGHQVVCAASVAEAVAVLRRERFAQVVLDHDLPDGVGTEVAALLAVRQPDARVVMHTSRVLAALPFGVGRVVRKQADLGSLLAALAA